MPVDALTKTGMLGSLELVELAVDRASRTREDGRPHLGFLTVDPVMVADARGHRLLERDAVQARCAICSLRSHSSSPPTFRRLRCCWATTSPRPRTSPSSAPRLSSLSAEGSRAGPPQGGPHGRRPTRRRARGCRGDRHLGGGQLGGVDPDGDVVLGEFHHRWIAMLHTHGTGCTLSAAITAEAAAAVHAGRDLSSPDAVAEAAATSLGYLARAIGAGSRWRLAYDPQDAHGRSTTSSTTTPPTTRTARWRTGRSMMRTYEQGEVQRRGVGRGSGDAREDRGARLPRQSGCRRPRRPLLRERHPTRTGST